MGAQHRDARLKQELAQLHKQHAWLSDQLQQATAGVTEARKEKVGGIVEAGLVHGGNITDDQNRCR